MIKPWHNITWQYDQSSGHYQVLTKEQTVRNPEFQMWYKGIQHTKETVDITTKDDGYGTKGGCKSFCACELLMTELV